jgi:tetratricopeptide (TPR) repeat protein
MQIQWCEGAAPNCAEAVLQSATRDCMSRKLTAAKKDREGRGQRGWKRRFVPRQDTEVWSRSEHVFELENVVSCRSREHRWRTKLDFSSALRINPNWPPTYYLLIPTYLALNRIEEAKATYAEAVKRNLDSSRFDLGLYDLAFLEHNPAEMARLVAQSRGIPGVEDELLASEADTAAYYGRLGDARKLTLEAVESAERLKLKEAGANSYAVSGLREELLGNETVATRAADAALQISSGRDVEYGAALALAFAGKEKRAQGLAADLDKRFPQDTIVQYNYLPTISALLSLARGNPSTAVADLESAKTYELGETTDSPIGWTAMYPVYVRGEAYVAAHQGSEAAAEFQKILDHPGIVLDQPIAALAHLQLGRAYALEAQSLHGADADAARAKARAVYQDFLTLWKDADPAVPVLQEAKAEYAKLK